MWASSLITINDIKFSNINLYTVSTNNYIIIMNIFGLKAVKLMTFQNLTFWPVGSLIFMRSAPNTKGGSTLCGTSAYHVWHTSNIPLLSYHVYNLFSAKIAYWPHTLIIIHYIEFNTNHHAPNIYQQLNTKNEQIYTCGCEVIDILRIWPFDLSAH